LVHDVVYLVKRNDLDLQCGMRRKRVTRRNTDHAFSQPSVLAIIAALEADGSDWAMQQVATLRKMSPTSLCVSLALLRRGAGMNLRQCLDEELVLTGSVVHGHPDFCEGVRSVLVDKGSTANWQPATLEQVDPAAITAMFSRAG
jgi:enoyl-CoA hydratase/carnithine racemase